MPVPPARLLASLASTALIITTGAVLLAPSASADDAALGTAASFAVLAGSTVTSTGPSVVSGDLGLSPGTSVTGFAPTGPGTVVNGTVHVADAVALQAKDDAGAAYVTDAGLPADQTVSADLGGRTLAPGVYTGGTLGLTGTLVLDGLDDPDATFVLRSDSTLITASASRVLLVRGASACNVHWLVGSSATLGTGSSLVGTVNAVASVTAGTGSAVIGRLLARDGAVTLDDTDVTRPTCALSGGTPGATPTGAPSASATPGPGPAATPTPTAGAGGPSPTTTPVPSGATPGPVPAVSGPFPGTPAPTAGTTSPPVSSSQQLPRTGSTSGAALATGSAAVLLGALLLLVARAPRGAHRRPARLRLSTD